MKKLLCLLVAMCAGVAAGQDAVPTAVEGATYQFGNTYAGQYAGAGHPDGGNVTISAGEGGQDMSLADIIGNWNDADNERAYWGTVTMTGGEDTIGTARLSYTEGVGLSLLLAPEPQTTTLALLSLAALLRRRRQK